MSQTTCLHVTGGGPQDSRQVEPVSPVSLSELVLVDQHAPQGSRVRQDERLDRLFEERCDWLLKHGRAGQLAVDCDEQSLTYPELDAKANRLARYLRLHGVDAGDRIALLFDRPTDSYVAMLAVLKIGAAYVALDASFPTERMAYVVSDAQARTVLSVASVVDGVERSELLTANGVELVALDQAAPLIDELDSRRLIPAERGNPGGQVAYITYTSDADGQLRGVVVEHPSICNFVKVAAEVYGIGCLDRVYQGLPIAFDFSVEETWVPWSQGATLVPRPPRERLLGRDLHRFLSQRRVTVMCCVPRVLATLRDDLPDLRILLVSGEICTEDLIERWHRPGRRFLNLYGPAEATVTTSWTELRPNTPATVGVPLPTYSTVILDVEDPYQVRPHGELGEIGIAGVGLARGYVNRDDLTEKTFIPDFLGIPANPSGRIYRTGHLGRVNSDREIEYHGRLEPRGRLCGFRAELAEIESALRPASPVAEVADAAADVAAEVVASGTLVPTERAKAPFTTPAKPAPLPPASVGARLAAVLAEVLGVDEVSVDGHFFDDLGADSMMMARFCARVRKRTGLPSVSMQDVYRNPSISRMAAALAPAASAEASPAHGTVGARLAAVLAEVLGVDEVSVDGHFFDDLGADSMMMARFCARVRKQPDLSALSKVSMQDIYRNPSISRLAAAFVAPAPVTVEASVPPSIEVVNHASGGERREKAPTGTPRYVLCGALQLLSFLGYSYLAGLATSWGFDWVSAGSNLLDIYLRSVLIASAGFVGMCTLPILAKWMLIGRWKPQQIRIWSLAYARFWVVKTLVRSNPLVLFIGSPLYVLYLRALGARIGRDAAIFSQHVPICTDLLTIGEGSVIRKDSFFQCYRAHAGLIQTGAVTLGKDVFVGEATVIDIGTSMGDGAQLGHTSSLHTGQAVPEHERWHGSPAQRTEVNYQTVGATSCGTLRKIIYTAVQLALMLGIYLPLGLGGVILLVTDVPEVAASLEPGIRALTSWTFYLNTLVLATVLFFGFYVVGLLVVSTVPRLLSLAIKPDRDYPLYGFHYWIHRMITRMTNMRPFTNLSGDSSFIVHYLRSIGYDLSLVEQTGSNFGMEMKHETPYLISVGSGTVVADALSLINADFSSTSFRVSRVSIGARNFLGNRIVYPAQGRTGDNCLLATKVMVPIDGEIREGIGLLGSPSFEIPRSVERDNALGLKSAEEVRRRLAEKNRHNAVTMAISLLVRWIYVFGLVLLEGMGVGFYDSSFGALGIALDLFLSPLFTVGYFVLVDRCVSWLQLLTPRGCSIYDPRFWRHERFWKVPSQGGYLELLNGTPFKNIIWRMLGVRIGSRVFDDGCYVTERTFAAIGDDCALNVGSALQCHSQEDGAFKSDRITIGSGCTLGVNAFVHYGVTMGDGAVLAPDSFLMKGEEIPPRAWWGGNPAKEIRNVQAGPAAK